MVAKAILTEGLTIKTKLLRKQRSKPQVPVALRLLSIGIDAYCVDPKLAALDSLVSQLSKSLEYILCDT